MVQNKGLTKKAIRKGIEPQLQYLRSNFRTEEKQLDGPGVFPLDHKFQRKYWTIQTLYDQQLGMYESRN